VQVVRVDMERRQVELGLVEILETVRRQERRGVPRSKTKSKKETRHEARPRQKRKQRPGRRERAGRRKL
jgi:hypothetical protein